MPINKYRANTRVDIGTYNDIGENQINSPIFFLSIFGVENNGKRPSQLILQFFLTQF